MKRQRGYIAFPDGAFAALITLGVCVGAAVTLLLVWGAPWLWALLKPWLHGVTA